MAREIAHATMEDIDSKVKRGGDGEDPMDSHKPCTSTDVCEREEMGAINLVAASEIGILPSNPLRSSRATFVPRMRRLAAVYRPYYGAAAAMGCVICLLSSTRAEPDASLWR